MRNCHELGEGWSPKDGVVHRLETSNLKRNILSSEVLPRAECDGQTDLPEWYRRGPRDYPVEWRAAPFQLGVWDLHVIQGLSKENVESAAAVNQYPIELNRPDDGIQYQGVTTWVR